MNSYVFESFSSAQYRHEVDQILLLSVEETAALGQRILLANQGQISQEEGLTARNALIHGHLHLVLTLTQSYPSSYRSDLIQEGNIGLLQAVEAYSFESGDFAAYATVAIRHAIADAMESVMPIRVPRSSLRAAKKHGTADRLYTMQPTSLEKPFPQDTELCLADTLQAPENAEEAARCQNHQPLSLPLVEALLGTLPGQIRQVMTLRYGLDEQDQREHTYAQIASKLGITRPGARKLEQSGLSILQGQRVQRAQLRRMAQESRLNAAYTLLKQSDVRISSRHLARIARVRDDIAIAYLQRIKQTGPDGRNTEPSTLGNKTYAKLIQAYHQLQEQNATVNVQALQKAAGVSWRTAKKFLDRRAQFCAHHQIDHPAEYRQAVGV